MSKKRINEEINRSELHNTKKYSIIDGSAYNVMVGFGEQYIVPFAVRLNASNSQIGILYSLPNFLGSLFQVFGANITDKLRNRKKIVTSFVLLQGITLLPIFILPLISKNITLLIILFSLYSIFGNIVAPSWHSWIGDVIPEKDRAKYFSFRSKIAITALLVSIVASGVILQIFDKINIWIGFGILFLIAFAGRMASWIYLKKQFEPKYQFNKTSYFSFKEFLQRMPKTNFGNFAMFRGLMAVAVMIAGPFFSVYLLRNLGFDYIHFTAIMLLPLLVKILTVRYWGKYSDKYGTKNVMCISSILISLVPLLWFIVGITFSQSPHIFYMLLFIELLTGFAWAGFDLTTFDYMLETTHPQKRARASAYFHVLFGTGHLVGGLLGAIMVKYVHISIMEPILFVFLISFIVRILVAILLANRMHEVKIKKNIHEDQLFIEMIIAKPIHTIIHYIPHSLSGKNGSKKGVGYIFGALRRIK